MEIGSKHALEIKSGRRFRFGDNWSKFLRTIDDRRIRLAEGTLCQMLGIETFRGKTFLDIGSGSGLFSLAARRLGARVHSFDYDPQSVACTARVRQRYFPADSQWTVEQGSVLDATYLESLGQSDVVYSWGVLHHTGAMWEALGNLAALVRPGGELFIAVYNDQGRPSKIWLRVKQAYNYLPAGLRWVVLLPAFVRLWGPTTIRDMVCGRPFSTWRRYGEKSMRGMSPGRDFVDWVGGLPFEVAKPEEIFTFYHARGFILQRLKTCAGGHGCNEFVFKAKQS